MNATEPRDRLCFILVVNFERLCSDALPQIFDKHGTIKIAPPVVSRN
jgi:hypothetical protein